MPLLYRDLSTRSRPLMRRVAFAILLAATVVGVSVVGRRAG